LLKNVCPQNTQNDSEIKNIIGGAALPRRLRMVITTGRPS
jgi:hypothetical protein